MQARADRETVKQIVENWPKVSKHAAMRTVNEYGLPNEASESRLIWHNNGPWLRTVIYKEEVEHNFPVPHHDVLEQYIRYRAPVGKLDELARFDGSVLIDRTKGEMSARCEGEEANFLALNLADEIAHGRRSADQARKEYGEAMRQMKAGKTPDIMKKLLFEPEPGDTGEKDASII